MSLLSPFSRDTRKGGNGGFSRGFENSPPGEEYPTTIGSKTMNSRYLAILVLFGFLFAETHGQWTSTQGPYGGIVRRIIVSGQNMFAAVDSGGVFLSTGSGASWNAVNSGLTNHSAWALCFNGSTLYAGTNGGGVYVSTNNGGSWTQVNSGITGTLFIHSLVVSGTYVLVAAPFGAFRMTNGGTTWTKVTNGLTNSDVIAYAVSGSNLFAGTLGGVFLSTNDGTSWSTASNGLTTSIVAAMVAAGSNLYDATYPSGVFLSTNSGSNWTSVVNNLGSLQVHCLASSGTNVFAGTDSGVYVSSNNGTNWTRMNSGLPAKAQVHSLTVASPYVFAGTDSFGVWQRPVSDMVTSVEQQLIGMAAQYELRQNYPNPFNPKTVVSFQLPVASDVRLAVCDLLGRELMVLLDDRVNPGIHTVTVDGSNLASGVYIYRMTAGQYVESKKMVLLR
jgi:hypothetical protein